MTVTALVSGGKDSIYAAYLAETQGRSVDELVTIRPGDEASMLYHTPNLALVPLQAEAWGKAHRFVTVDGVGEDAELAALATAIEGARGWVVAGAIESSYQWSRLLEVAGRAGRPVYTPLWRKDPERVVRAEIAAGLDARIVRVAAETLGPDLLGRRLDPALLEEIVRRSARQRATHVAGEGGEYETLVLDAPFFHARLHVDAARASIEPSTASWQVERAHLEEKPAPGRWGARA
ncbi:MAG TPA: diphthine--ammonia ligase [Thermoplasmata archaeon]|nr:diphthine--ammonia ligase [Thermoplasmata archaeon]